MLKRLNFTFLLLALTNLLHSQNMELDQWNYYKNIGINDLEKEYSSIILDKEVYKSVDFNLASLRIIDEDDNFIPYYIDNLILKDDVSTSLASKRINVEKRELSKIEFEQTGIYKDEINFEEKVFQTFFDFQILPSDKRTKGNKLKLNVKGDDYSEQIVIWGRHEDTDWVKIGINSLYKFDGFVKNQIEFENTIYYTFYRLGLYNNRNEIEIKELALVQDGIESGKEHFKKQIELPYEVSTKDKFTTILMKNTDTLKLYSLSIESEGAYKRDYTLKTIANENDENSKFSYGKIYNFDFKSISIKSNVIDFPTRSQNIHKIELKINNKDNPSLNIESITAQYLVDKIIFKFQKGKSYRLFYGNEKAVKPMYDIVEFKEYINNDDISEGILQNRIVLNEVKVKKDLPLEIIFNVLIVLVALILIFVIVLKLKPKKA